ncbi:hypothetical protein CC2G_014795 [Coprinopsis cinerea AmutBmut pab1-1]|nr:hypothetical protein CC2G_014795 [Coprinopsis cinerea AmutBmut pab1-1]
MDSEALILRFDEWIEQARRRVEQHSLAAESLKNIIVIGAFIAGVQSQLLTSTIELDRSQIADACNTLSFMGLVAEIVGTFFGSVNALKLHKEATVGDRYLSELSKCRADLKLVFAHVHHELTKETLERTRVETQQQYGSALNNTGAGVFKDLQIHYHFNKELAFDPKTADLVDTCYEIQKTLDGLMKGTKYPVPSEIVHLTQALFNKVGEIALRDGTLRRPVPRIQFTPSGTTVGVTIEEPHEISQAPIWVMGLGVIFLGASVILFAAAKQEELSRRLWITSLAFGGALTLWCIPRRSPILTWKRFKSRWLHGPKWRDDEETNRRNA